VHHHDLVVIGTGSGNSIVDERFVDLDVAFVEHGVFGGTCLNAGCIPTKMYVHPADVAEEIRTAARFGVDATVDKVRWADIRDRVFDRIDPISVSGRHYRSDRCGHVALYAGHARFTGRRELQVERRDGTSIAITAERIVIAAGTRPLVPPELTGVPLHTSETIMRIDDLPEHLLIVGSGYIAAEFAHVFSAFGTRVSIVGRSAPMLRGQDGTVMERFTALARRRWDVHLGHGVARATGDASEITLELTDGTVLRGDLLLAATGRIPNSDRLDLPRAGIPVHPDGRIVVDAQQRTPVEGVFALDYAVTVKEYGEVAYGWAMEDTTGFCKILAERGTARLLGAHLMGPQASTLIQPLVQAMSFDLDARSLASGQYWIHPALPELVENALLALDV